METYIYDGVVSNVPDPDTFDLTYSGVIHDVDDSTYDDGTIYYLSEVTAGDSKDTPPAPTFYQVPVYHAFLDNDGSTLNLLVYPGRPLSQAITDVVIDKGITKTAHGFTVGTIIFWDSDLGTYRLAKADDAETCVYDGVVSNVPDVNTFDLTYSGVIKNVDSSTYDVGTTYYLSEVTAGNSKDLPPAATFYQVPVYHCFKDSDGTTLDLLVYPGRPLGSSHLAIVAGDASSGGGTARIWSTATVYWDINTSGVMSVNSGSNVNSMSATQSQITDGTASATITKNSLAIGTGATINSMSPTQSEITDGTSTAILQKSSLALSNGTITSTFTYDTIVLGSSMEPIFSIDIYPSTVVHLNLNSAGVLSLTDISNNAVSLQTTQIVSSQTVSGVVTKSTLTPTSLAVGATPSTPTSYGSYQAAGLAFYSASAITCQLSATVMTMTLSATNSFSIAASDITDTSQVLKCRKISICDPATGLVKNTWLPCSAPF